MNLQQEQFGLVTFLLENSNNNNKKNPTKNKKVILWHEHKSLFSTRLNVNVDAAGWTTLKTMRMLQYKEWLYQRGCWRLNNVYINADVAVLTAFILTRMLQFKKCSISMDAADCETFTSAWMLQLQHCLKQCKSCSIKKVCVSVDVAGQTLCASARMLPYEQCVQNRKPWSEKWFYSVLKKRFRVISRHLPFQLMICQQKRNIPL